MRPVSVPYPSYELRPSHMPSIHCYKAGASNGIAALFRVKRSSVLFTSMSVFCVLSLKYDFTFHTHGLLL